MKSRTRKIIIRCSVFLFFTGTVFYFHKQVVRVGYRVYREYEWRNFPENIYSGRIDVPGNYSVHGIDVSRWQSNLDWKNLSALNSKGDTIPLSFAFIKATEGILWEDPMFEDNWTSAKKAGVTRGAYHYFKPNSSPTLQAKNFIGSVTLKPGDLPPVLDVEET
ncbi:MAG: glycoside hydrolase family 25 protein, partial [Chitinophagales bacterium]